MTARAGKKPDKHHADLAVRAPRNGQDQISKSEIRNPKQIRNPKARNYFAPGLMEGRVASGQWTARKRVGDEPTHSDRWRLCQRGDNRIEDAAVSNFLIGICFEFRASDLRSFAAGKLKGFFNSVSSVGDG
jgi:hypothetical protein